MKLIEHIVMNDQPIAEVVTADCIMVWPYTARGYGIDDEIKSQIQNPDNPFEYLPVKLKALVGRNRSEDQSSATGSYPHADRLRARMYCRHLGIDALEPGSGASTLIFNGGFFVDPATAYLSIAFRPKGLRRFTR